MSADWLGFAAAALALGTGVVWFRKMNAVRIPQNRAVYLGAMGASAALGVVALALGSGFAGGAAAVVAISLATLFTVLRLQSAQAATQPAVEVGGRILDFTALDDEAKPFELASLRGKPFLLKFFRGHW